METAQKAGHGTKTHGFKKALGGYAISTNLQMVREAPPPKKIELAIFHSFYISEHLN